LVLSTHVQIWNIKTCQSHDFDWGNRENNGGNESNHGTIYVFMEISHLKNKLNDLIFMLFYLRKRIQKSTG
jgi:hypothetical protein